MLRATTACTFSTSQLPKVVRSWCVLYILTWKCASRHNGVQIFISHLASWLRTRRFSEPTFRPSGATNQWKNTVFRDFPTFSRICIFFLLTFSLLIFSLLIFSLLTLPTSAFQLSMLSEVSLLNFLRLNNHYVTMFVFPLKRYFWGSLFWANPPKTLQKESSTTRTICVVQLAVDIWRFPQMGDPQNAWFTIEHPTKMDDLVVPVPPFQETCIYIIYYII